MGRLNGRGERPSLIVFRQKILVYLAQQSGVVTIAQISEALKIKAAVVKSSLIGLRMRDCVTRTHRDYFAITPLGLVRMDAHALQKVVRIDPDTGQELDPQEEN